MFDVNFVTVFGAGFPQMPQMWPHQVPQQVPPQQAQGAPPQGSVN